MASAEPALRGDRRVRLTVMPMGLPPARMTSSEYLDWEREQLDRHEFYRGEVFAMSGGSLRHSALGLAIGSELRIAA